MFNPRKCYLCPKCRMHNIKCLQIFFVPATQHASELKYEIISTLVTLNRTSKKVCCIHITFDDLRVTEVRQRIHFKVNNIALVINSTSLHLTEDLYSVIFITNYIVYLTLK